MKIMAKYRSILLLVGIQETVAASSPPALNAPGLQELPPCFVIGGFEGRRIKVEYLSDINLNILQGNQ